MIRSNYIKNGDSVESPFLIFCNKLSIGKQDLSEFFQTVKQLVI